MGLNSTARDPLLNFAKQQEGACWSIERPAKTPYARTAKLVLVALPLVASLEVLHSFSANFENFALDGYQSGLVLLLLLSLLVSVGIFGLGNTLLWLGLKLSAAGRKINQDQRAVSKQLRGKSTK